MKRLLAIFIFCIACLQSNSQQLSQYSHFISNYFAYNPAVAGSAPCLDLKLGFKSQWTGFSGAPNSAFGAMHGNFGEKRNSLHGFGALSETDNAGPIGYTNLMAAYAYHFKVSERYMLSMGLGVGFNQFRIDLAGITLDNYDDPAITAQASNFIFPIFDFGMWLYRDDRFYGFSIKNVNEQLIEGLGYDSKLRRHYFLTAGKSIEINDEFELKPAVMIKYVRSAPLSVDINAMMHYKDLIALGATYRNQNGLAFLLQVDAFRYVRLAYSYDLSMSKIRYGSRSSHEIILGIRACDFKDKGYVPCSAYE